MTHETRTPSDTVDILRRAAIAAAIIGAGLTLYNQQAALFGPPAVDWPSVALSFASPFVVVIISQLLGIRAARRETGRPEGRGAESFWRTVTSHGIARRALITALLVGTVLSAIMVVLAGGGQAGPVPTAQIAQVYALPLIFGALSQALSYRRARARAPFRRGRPGEAA